jgi:bifunctional non-homologous end joining protein LigD
MKWAEHPNLRKQPSAPSKGRAEVHRTVEMLLLIKNKGASEAGFIAPCLPSPAERPPTGPRWIHEIKHDGYRLMARRDPTGVRLLTRNATPPLHRRAA